MYRAGKSVWVIHHRERSYEVRGRMFGIIIIIYFTAGTISGWLFLVKTYKEYGKIESDDIAAAFAVFSLGALGLLVHIVNIIIEWLEDNRPVESLLDRIADKITRLFDKLKKNNQ